MTGSSSTEDDGAVVAPLTFGAAMTEEKVELTQEELYADKTDRFSGQKATLKSTERRSMHFAYHQNCLAIAPLLVVVLCLRRELFCPDA